VAKWQKSGGGGLWGLGTCTQQLGTCGKLGSIGWALGPVFSLALPRDREEGEATLFACGATAGVPPDTITPLLWPAGEVGGTLISGYHSILGWFCKIHNRYWEVRVARNRYKWTGTPMVSSFAPIEILLRPQLSGKVTFVAC
jgi:hypothetical protein